DQLDPAQRRQRWVRNLQDAQLSANTTVLAHHSDGVAGFAQVSASRDADADPIAVGEVTAIYLLPQCWGSGGGQMLMDAALRRLTDAGYLEATLWVLDSNARARRFYEAGGWQPDRATKTDNSRGFPLLEIRYRRRLQSG